MEYTLKDTLEELTGLSPKDKNHTFRGELDRTGAKIYDSKTPGLNGVSVRGYLSDVWVIFDRTDTKVVATVMEPYRLRPGLISEIYKETGRSAFAMGNPGDEPLRFQISSEKALGEFIELIQGPARH